MTFQNYLDQLYVRFEKNEDIPELRALSFYEEEFRVEWLATKLKQYSFVSHVEHLTADLMKQYSKDCMDYALKNYKNMPRGIQNGVVSNNVLVSGNVDPMAIKLVEAKPKKHYAAFEIPIIVDLTQEKIFYCKKTPLWGAMYYKYFREYISKKFILIKTAA